MLKFIKHNMESIVGIEIFPIISVLIFFLFFVGLIIYVFMMKQSSVDELSSIPFQDNADIINPSKTNGNE